MKVIIFGASGSIGRHVVRKALDQGHGVTAFARDPAKIGSEHDGLVRRAGDRGIVRAPGGVQPGERLQIRVARAELEALVESVRGWTPR